MDEKMKKVMDQLFAKLTDEQKEKAKECKTLDELMEFAGKEGVELPDEMLENVGGGLRIQWQKVDLTYDSPATSQNPGVLDVPPPPRDFY